MTASRLEQLLKFREEDPHDPFPVYGLALEYLKFDIKKSEAYFDDLLNQFPDYLPTYYHAAKVKTTVGKNEAAINIYKRGIELAVNLNDRATHRELLAAYEELVF